MPDGCTMREHYEAIERQTGIPEPAMAPIECQPSVKYIWGYFSSLNLRRREGSITHSDVLAWSVLNGISLSPFELKCLDAIEHLYQRKAMEALKEARKK